MAFTGINIGFGGIATLGWQGQSSFLQVTNEQAFLVQDSHVRFLGGMWLGVGALFFLAATDPAKYRNVLGAALTLIFLGGLARFTQMEFQILFGPDLASSLLAELVGIPLLYFWLLKTTRNKSSAKELAATAGLHGSKEKNA
ncbi:MAG: hypothetical protein A3I66_03785 [Burkholderiales bacterium RIFCSPLOWO2_02_FULL_57_36]|nr:MAG: hypothetical protein A3I66_03785 [Burkholderiales bacterium RIFCSPLOWO2_02_FULL_57_36]